MDEYYFFVSLLPPLEIGHVPSLGFSELKALMDVNLKKSDRKIVRTFLSLIDFENMRALWSGEPFDQHGNYNREQMVHAIADETWPNGETFPWFLSEYLEKYRTPEDRLRHFPLLLSQFFTFQIENETGFLRDYFAFQRDIRLVMLGFRTKKLGKDLAEQLQYEDGTDEIVAFILAQRDSKSFEPPFEYKELRPIFDEYASDPLELYQAFYVYQFNHIIELWGGEPFGLGRILNYLARLILVERWLELDVQKGIHVVDTIEKEIA